MSDLIRRKLSVFDHFLHQREYQKENENEEMIPLYKRLYDKPKDLDLMKIKGNSGKKVIVEIGDIVDGQRSEIMELIAEKAVTKESVKGSENGSGDAELDSLNVTETENGFPLKMMSSQDIIWPLWDYIRLFWYCKKTITMTVDKVKKSYAVFCKHIGAFMDQTNIDVLAITIVQNNVFSGELPKGEEKRHTTYRNCSVIHKLPGEVVKRLDCTGLAFICKHIPENLTKQTRLALAVESKDERAPSLLKHFTFQLRLTENDWEIFDLDLKEMIGTLEIPRSICKTNTVIISQARVRNDEQTILNRMINRIIGGLPIMHIKDWFLTDKYDLTTTWKISINECISKRAELYVHQLLWMTKVPLMSYDINCTLCDAPLIDDIFEIRVLDFKTLYISALYEVAIDPLKIFDAWMKKMTHRRLNDNNFCLSKTSHFFGFKLKTADTVAHSQKSNTNIFSFVWKEVSLHTPENRQPLPSDMDFESSFVEHSLNQCPIKQIANIRLKFNQNKPMCKPIYGTVDLKIGQDISVSKSHEPERDSSDGGKKKRVTKEAILSNSFQQMSSNYFTVFPVHKRRDKKQQKRPESQSENVDNVRNAATDDSANGSEIEANRSTEEEGACANTETYIQKRRIDKVSIDCQQSSSQSVQTDSYKGESTLLAENALSGNILERKLCLDKSEPDNNNETQTISGQSSQHNFISRTEDNIKTKESTAESSEHDSWQTTISRHPTSTDGRSGSNCTDPVINQAENQSFDPLMCIINKISRGESVPPQVSMQYEMLRFCTLRSFPKENKPYITRLAQAGFYYARTSDEVVCYCCAQRKRNWQENDIPMDVHRQLNPNCKFLLQNSEVNVPIKTDESYRGILTSLQGSSYMRSASGDATGEDREPPDTAVTSTTRNTSDTVVQSSNKLSSRSATRSNISNPNEGKRDEFVSSYLRSSASINYPHGNFVQASAPQPQNNENRLLAASTKTFEPLYNESGRLPTQTGGDYGTHQTALPKYPKYAIRTVRMSSFSDCRDIVVSRESLVDAGFFYSGFGDCVRCFQCGVGLRHWSVEDDPWIEHSRWSKECSYVKQMRGQEFVNIVQMAVQYQSDQQNNEAAQHENISGSNQSANGRDEVEMLLHKNSAQSVMEMGYDPGLIRRAIRAILKEKGREAVSAASLMEKIFEIEEVETRSENSVEQGEVLELSNQAVNHTASSMLESESSKPLIESKGFAETTRGELQNATTTENTETRSRASLSLQLASSQLGSSNNTRVSRSSQLLEKRRLKEENEKLKQQSLCTNCRINEVCIVFLPCGHLVTCETCAPTIKYCTVQTCGKYIKGTLRTYLS